MCRNVGVVAGKFNAFNVFSGSMCSYALGENENLKLVRLPIPPSGHFIADQKLSSPRHCARFSKWVPPWYHAGINLLTSAAKTQHSDRYVNFHHNRWRADARGLCRIVGQIRLGKADPATLGSKNAVCRDPQSAINENANGINGLWRSRRDSNPRYPVKSITL